MLDKDNYFSPEMQRQYMGVSQFKAFEVCEAAALAEIGGTYEREQTPALLVGSYVDAWFEGTLNRFREDHPELFKRDGSLKAEYGVAQRVIDRVRRDSLFMGYMAGTKQVVMTGSIEGVPIKIKVDSLLPDKIVDGKVMRNFEPVYKPGMGRLIWPEAWGYDIQGAVYQEIVRQNTGDRLPFYLAAATKEPEPNIEIVHISQPYLDAAMDRVRESIQRYDAIKAGAIDPLGCGHCRYCRGKKILHAPIEMEDLFDE